MARSTRLEQPIPRVFQLLHHLAYGSVQPVRHQLLLLEGQRRELLAEVTVNHVLHQQQRQRRSRYGETAERKDA